MYRPKSAPSGGVRRRGRVVPCAVVAACAAAALLIPFSAPVAERLSLEEAVEVAAERDPQAARYRARATAAEEAAVAAGALPDPELTAGLMNLPADDPSLRDDPMTQLNLGVRQAFPSGRGAAREQELARASVERAEARDALRRVRRETRQAYLEVYYRTRQVAILEGTRVHFEELIDAAERAMAAGDADRQEVLQAELELERLEDRTEDARIELETARSRLARWVGPQWAQRPLQEPLPELSLPPGDAAALEMHPRLGARAAQLEQGRAQRRRAEAAYRPDWGVELSYALRQADRPDGSSAPDLISGMVTVQLPLFPGSRQDRDLAAARHGIDAAREGLRDAELALREELRTAEKRRERLAERVERYDAIIVELATDNAEAALSAYGAGTVEFVALHRARIDELDARLARLRLAIQERQSRADIRYLLGEPS